MKLRCTLILIRRHNGMQEYGRSMLACQLWYQESKMHFLAWSVSVYRACKIYVLTLSVHTANLVSGETMFMLMLSEQLHQRSCKGWGEVQREVLAHCARNLRFGPQFYNQPTNLPTPPTKDKFLPIFKR